MTQLLKPELIGATLALYLFAVMATYALAITVTKLDGPFELLLKFRIRVGVYDLAQNGQPKSGMGKAFSCPLCIGTWIGLVVALVISPLGWHQILLWWAINGGLFTLVYFLD